MTITGQPETAEEMKTIHSELFSNRILRTMDSYVEVDAHEAPTASHIQKCAKLGIC